MSEPEIRFLLPPSLGVVRAGDLTGPLSDYLSRVTGQEVTVYVAPDYAAVEDDLLFGSADVAWAPPLLSGRVEEDGGEFILHCVRRGATRYRGALVRKKGADVAAENLKQKRAAWVSLESTGGYLLVRRWLDEQGIDDVADETFHGNYADAVRAVLADEADFTAVFCSPEGQDPIHSALDELDDVKGVDGLELFAFTSDELNDGIVVSPQCDEEVKAKVRAALAEPDDEGKAVIAKVFHADELAPPT